MAAVGTAPIPITCRAAHRRYAEWTPDRFRRWAGSIGPNTEGLVIAILANRPHPEQGFRTCLGVLRLFTDLDAGTRRSGLGPRRRDRRAHLQEHRLHPRQQARPPASRRRADAVIDHANLRGPGYFH